MVLTEWNTSLSCIIIRKADDTFMKQAQSSDRTNTWTPPTTIWNSMFIGVFMANIGLSMGQQMSNSLLSLYAKSLGAPADQIGALMSMFAITALICRFFAGPSMNAFNRKKLNIFAMSVMTTAYVGFSLSPTISELTGIPVIRILQAFRLFQGFGNSFGSACLLTIVSDALPKDKFSSGMGYFACAQTISQAIGPTVGIFLRDLFGYNITYIINACVMICAIISCAAFVRLAPRTPVKFQLKLSSMIAKEALIPAGITFLVGMGFTSISSFLLVYAEERGVTGGSFFFTVYAVSMLVTRPIIGKLTDKYGFVKVSIPALFMTACSLALIGFANSLPMLLFAAFVNAFGYGAVQPALQSLCMKSVPTERRGSASSTNYIGMDSATIIGPTVCGWVASAFGYVPLMWISMTVPILFGIVFIFVTRKKIGMIETSFNAAAN